MLEFEVLVLELSTIDGLATRSVVLGNVTTLNQQTGDDAIEDGALVVQRFAQLLAQTHLARP